MRAGIDDSISYKGGFRLSSVCPDPFCVDEYLMPIRKHSQAKSQRQPMANVPALIIWRERVLESPL